MTDRLILLDSVIADTRDRLLAALETIESIDDPGPGADLISVALAITDAINLADTLAAGQNVSRLAIILEGGRHPQ